MYTNTQIEKRAANWYKTVELPRIAEYRRLIAEWGQQDSGLAWREWLDAQKRTQDELRDAEDFTVAAPWVYLPRVSRFGKRYIHLSTRVPAGGSLPYLPDEKLIMRSDLLKRVGWTDKRIKRLLPVAPLRTRIGASHHHTWLLSTIMEAENSDEFVAANKTRRESRKIAKWYDLAVFTPTQRRKAAA